MQKQSKIATTEASENLTQFTFLGCQCLLEEVCADAKPSISANEACLWMLPGLARSAQLSLTLFTIVTSHLARNRKSMKELGNNDRRQSLAIM